MAPDDWHVAFRAPYKCTYLLTYLLNDLLITSRPMSICL